MDIKELKIPGYETVIKAFDPSSGLRCFIAIHSTKLGPALGGARFYPYKSEEEALEDALRLSEAMTLKSALAEDGLGGGKAVIMGDPRIHKTPALLKAFGKAVDSLKGRYIVAEDVGTTPDDMLLIREQTAFVAAMPRKKSSGDPSLFTAYGVFLGIQAVAETLFRTPALEGVKIAVQGVGSVGAKLIPHLFYAGAELFISDLDPLQTELFSSAYSAKIVPVSKMLTTPCDIFSPCAMGGVLNPETIPHLRCKGVAGSANNQLGTKDSGALLFDLGILYAPDIVINAGGILNAAAEFDPGGYDAKKVLLKVRALYPTLLAIFKRSKKEHKPTDQIALEMAKQKLYEEKGKRLHPLSFS